MNKIHRVLLFIVILGLTTSCLEKEIYNPTNSENELKIPDGFNWKTTQDVTCEVRVQPTYISTDAEEAYQVVRIYKSADLEEGSLLAGGSAKSNIPYTCKLNVPSSVTDIYVEIIQPSGKRSVRTVPVVNSTVQITETSTMTVRAAATQQSAPEIEIPQIFDETITGSKSMYINTNKNYLIPAGETFTGEITSSGNATPTIYIAGKLKQQKSFNPNICNVVVLSGGEIEATDIAIISSRKIHVCAGGKINVEGGSKAEINISSNAQLINAGEISISGNLDLSSGVIENYGDIEVGESTEISSSAATLRNYNELDTKDINVNSSATFINNSAAEIEVANTMYLSSSTFINSGYAEIKKMEMSGGKLDNFCQIEFEISAEINNATYNAMEGSLTQIKTLTASASSINMEKGSIVTFQTLDKKNYNVRFTAPKGNNEYALLKKTGESSLHDLGYALITFDGKLEFVYGGLKENNEDRFPERIFTNGAYIIREQTKSISASECNSGIGAIEKDSDGDGIVDNLDQFPNDKDRAFISYFPSKDTWATYAFEDSWPAMGDYDMNDMVLGAQFSWILNAQNQVVDMVVKTNVRAFGGSTPIATAIQLDGITSSQIASASGYNNNGLFSLQSNGVENGSTYAVIPLFDKLSDITEWTKVGAYGNTLPLPEGGRIASDTLTIKIAFAAPIAQNRIDISKLNLFIMTETEKGAGIDRSHEIHLADFGPTSKSEIQNTANYPYRTTDGMVWGLMIPESFDYPYEKAHLKDAFINFIPWANSGGKAFPDWYKNKDGYRNTDKIFRK